MHKVSIIANRLGIPRFKPDENRFSLRTNEAWQGATKVRRFPVRAPRRKYFDQERSLFDLGSRRNAWLSFAIPPFSYFRPTMKPVMLILAQDISVASHRRTDGARSDRKYYRT
jgi:hypothetical protein